MSYPSVQLYNGTGPYLRNYRDLTSSRCADGSETQALRDVREYIAAVHEWGRPLDPARRRVLECLLHADLSTVRMYSGPRTDEFTSRWGIAGFAHGEEVHLGSAALSGPAGDVLLAHELVHVLQQRGGMVETGAVPKARRDALEREAVSASFRLLAGQPCSIDPQPDSPDIQAALPLIEILLLLAAAAGIGLLAEAAETPEHRRMVQSDPNPHPYETAWGLIPFYGSVDEVIEARSRWDRVVGTGFLMLDLTMAGSVVHGLVFGFKGLARIGLGRVSAGTATLAQREAFQKTLGQGVTFHSTEGLAREVMKKEGPVVLVGTQGFLPHSVTYVISQGRIWKIHGGIFQLFFGEGTKVLTREGLMKIARPMNTATLYRVSDTVAQDGVRWWEEQISAGVFRNLQESVGCAGSQVILMQQLGLGVPEGIRAGNLFSPLFPLFMEGARLGEPGLHYILNPLTKTRLAAGTLAQMGFFWALPRSVAWGLTNMLPIHPFFNLHRSQPAKALFAEELSPLELFSDLEYTHPLIGDGEMTLQMPPEYVQSLTAQNPAKPVNGSGDSFYMSVEVSPLAEAVYRNLSKARPKGTYDITRETGLSPGQIQQAISELGRYSLIVKTRMPTEAGFGYIRVGGR